MMPPLVEIAHADGRRARYDWLAGGFEAWLARIPPARHAAVVRRLLDGDWLRINDPHTGERCRMRGCRS